MSFEPTSLEECDLVKIHLQIASTHLFSLPLIRSWPDGALMCCSYKTLELNHKTANQKFVRFVTNLQGVGLHGGNQ